MLAKTCKARRYVSLHLQTRDGSTSIKLSTQLRAGSDFHPHTLLTQENLPPASSLDRSDVYSRKHKTIHYILFVPLILQKGSEHQTAHSCLLYADIWPFDVNPRNWQRQALPATIIIPLQTRNHSPLGLGSNSSDDF
jgi:hypothetical protein